MTKLKSNIKNRYSLHNILHFNHKLNVLPRDALCVTVRICMCVGDVDVRFQFSTLRK